MLVTISVSNSPSSAGSFPATDLGYVLHKHPERVQSFAVTGGHAYVFYPEATPKRCTAALLVTIDAIDLVRTLRGGRSLLLQHYVNDRPYVASSFTSSAIAGVFSSALNGKCPLRPELVEQTWSLTARVSVVRSKAGERAIRRVFEPLGYAVAVEPYALDEHFSDWGPSPYFTLTLTGEGTVQALLNHLYVLLPVLDNEKHYFISRQEVDILLAKGAGWLAVHPEREWITHRFLKRVGRLAREALNRLTATEDEAAEEDADWLDDADPVVTEKRQSLHTLRLRAALDALRASGARSVVDLGCGEGRLLKLLLSDGQFERIVGMDVSYRSLLRAKEALQIDTLSPFQRGRIDLFQGSLLYRDDRLEGFDAGALVEVIEHVEPERLPALERVVFEFAAPATVVVTTPNAEYNERYGLDEGLMRHADHRFEWTRAQFRAWAGAVCERFGYAVDITGVGEPDPIAVAPSQMAVFRKR